MREELRDRDDLDPSIYWSYHDRLPAVLAYKSRPKAPPSAAQTLAALATFHNPYEGEPLHARQLDESPTAFVKRLPPSTTHRDDAGPWLWIANPHEKHSFLDHDLSTLRTRGEALLEDYTQHKRDVEQKMEGKAAATITKRLRSAQAELAKDIRDLAVECNVKSGKWMLFPQIEDLDRTWRTVCEGVVNRKLGDSAKVATAGSERGQEGVRLICVYTHDFTDEKDVRRVLDELVDMGLVDEEEGKPVWYKVDAYTHLGIESKNEYGLRASLFGSQAMLAKSKK